MKRIPIGCLPERLKKSRERKGLTQKEVAEQLPVSSSTISDYEVGARQPSLSILLSLSEIYDISIDYLLGRDKTEPPYPLDTVGLSDEQIAVLKQMIKVMKHG